jgi:hypothetical protein
MLFHPFIRKGHIVAKPSWLINYFILFFIILKLHIIIDLGITCKVHAMSTLSFYSIKSYKKCFDRWMACVNNL